MKYNYNWYCPQCGSIIMKTLGPIIGHGLYRCSGCQSDITSDAILIKNKKNLKQFIGTLERKI